jgi:hypothetical protein
VFKARKQKTPNAILRAGLLLFYEKGKFLLQNRNRRLPPETRTANGQNAR